MIRAGKPLSALLLVLVAGCTSSPTPKAGRASNWSGDFTPWSSVASPAPPGPNDVSGSAVRGKAAAEQLAETETWVSLRRWSQDKSYSVPEKIVVAGLPGWQVRGPGGVFQLRAGSRIGYWDGVEVNLGFAPQMINDEPFVHRVDLGKTLQPLLGQLKALPLSGTPMIIIDPGHGGEDPGTLNVNGGATEKHLTLDWALRLQKLILAQGWKAVLTRTNDVFISIPDRVAISENLAGSVFISLHFNSASPSTSGVETFCLTPTGAGSHLVRGYFDGPEQVFPNNAYDEANLLLACRVHSYLLQATGNRDRGVRRARFPGVLRPQQRPAILVEGGYLSNPEEARRIADPKYRELLAGAVARALISSFSPSISGSSGASSRIGSAR